MVQLKSKTFPLKASPRVDKKVKKSWLLEGREEEKIWG